MKPNKASSTAHLIAAGTVFLSKVPELKKFVPMEWVVPCESFVKEYSQRGPFLLKLIGKKWFRSLVFLYENMMIPGMMLHYVLRKHIIEELAVKSLNENFLQVIIMGGGFDTLALRLHKRFQEATFFEMDFPATQKVKMNALRKSAAQGDNLIFIPVDFTDDHWEQTLQKNQKFDPNKKSLFISEGVLMYLTLNEVDRVFRFVNSESNNNRRFIFTFMNRLPNGKNSFQNASWLVDPWLKAKGEVFKWGHEKEKISDFLKNKKASLLSFSDTETIQSRFLSDSNDSKSQLAIGECIALAEWR